MKKFPNSSPPQRGSAFTLIELLVVIAIIAILAAILFPVFGRARENARRSTCISNMKQIGLGIAQYTNDYDGIFPQPVPVKDFGNLNEFACCYNAPAESDGSSAAVIAANPHYRQTWPELLNPYIKSYQVFTCPSQTGVDLKDGATFNPDYVMSYGLNKLLAWRNESSVVAPSRTILSYETMGNLGFKGYNVYAGQPFIDAPRALTPETPYKYGVTVCGGTYTGFTTPVAPFKYDKIHLGTNVFLYIDGHAKAIRYAGPTRTVHPYAYLSADGGFGAAYGATIARGAPDPGSLGCPPLFVPDLDPGSLTG